MNANYGIDSPLIIAGEVRSRVGRWRFWIGAVMSLGTYRLHSVVAVKA